MQIKAAITLIAFAAAVAWAGIAAAYPAIQPLSHPGRRARL